jgi:hypothetical protein
MRHQLSLKWGYHRYGPGSGGSRRITDWPAVDEALEIVKNESGSVELSIVDPPEIGPESVQVFAETGNFLLTLFELTEDDSHVRSFTNPDIESRQVEIGGNLWDSRMITKDFAIVRRAFREFFDTGDVSRDLLD